MDVYQLLSVAKQAAVEAGKEILDVYESDDFGIELKSDQSPLTRADQAAHNVIARHLTATGLPLLSEEGSQTPYSERKEWVYYWLVDPLDGTKEFIKRNGEFTVNIALIHKGVPVAGVIYAPCLDLLYVGSKETGVYKVKAGVETKLVRADASNSLDCLLQRPEVTVVASKNHMNAETEAFIDRFKQIHLQSMGSSLKLMLLAEGRADIYPRLGPTMEWDTAAGHAILNALDRCVYQTSMTEELTYNKPDLLNPSFVAL